MMVPKARLTACTILIVLNALITLVASDIYLSSTASATWLGDCNEDCPLASPCAPLDSSSMQPLSNAPCKIVFLASVYPNTAFRYTTNIITEVSIDFFGNVSNLNFGFDLTGPGSKISVGSSTKSSLNLSLLFLRAQNGELAASNLTLVDSQFDLNGIGMQVELTNLSFVNTVDGFQPSVAINNQQIQVAIYNSSFDVDPGYTNAYLTSVYPVSITIIGATGSLRSLITPTSASNNVQIIASDLVFHDRLVNSDSNSISDIWIIRDSIITGAGPDVYHMNLPTLYINNTELNDFGFGALANITVHQTYFKNCFINTVTGAYIRFDNVIFEISNPLSGLALRSDEFYSLDILFKNVTVFSATAALQQYPKVYGKVAFQLGSDLSTDSLFFKGNSTLKIDFLTVMDSILSTDQLPSYLLPGSHPNATWTLGSVYLFNTICNMSSLPKLRYYVTLPNRGILDGTKMIEFPTTTHIFWPSNLRTMPMASVNYYIVQNSSSVLSSSIQVEGEVLSQYEAEALTGPDFDSLQFRLTEKSPTMPATSPIAEPLQPNVPIFDNNLLQPSGCSAPPGFLCVGGVWMQQSSNSTETIHIPSQAGTIVIVGNLTLSGPIVFEGRGSSINVSGCIDVQGIELDLGNDVENLPSNPVTIASQSATQSCSKSLNDIPFNLKQNSRLCKKASATRNTENSRSTLSVTFSLNSSGCSSDSWKWILLGCILGAVVLVALFAAIFWVWWNRRFDKALRAAEAANQSISHSAPLEAI